MSENWIDRICTRMREVWNADKIPTRKSKGIRSFGQPRRRWEKISLFHVE
jgi:hypothetical protein